MIDKFINLLEETEENLNVVDFLEKLVLDTGIFSYYQSRYEAEDKDSSSSRVRNIYELIASFNDGSKDLTTNEGNKLRDVITTYLNNIMLLTPLDTKDSEIKNKVRLMTIHSAKGLEFPCVIIAGFENELLPLENTLLTKEHIEEERRLAYVAVTRAKRELIITYSNYRFDFRVGGLLYKGKSFFIDELDKEFVSFKKFVPSND
jgi:DNA helicase-2/ATP-dependent DNA helicase PcrA